jgi:integrase
MPNRPKEPHAQLPRKLESGQWQARITYYDADTGRRHETSQSFVTEREAKKWGRAQEIAYRTHPNQRPPTAELLTDYLDRWLQQTIIGYKTDSTALRYRLSLVHVQRLIGRIPLSKLTAQDIQKVYNALLSDGKASSTVKHVHVVLHAALEQAVTWDLIPKNPTRGTKPPQPQTHELVIPTRAQSQDFMDVCEKDRFFALWAFIAFTGVRRGEALALQWGDIDWPAKTVTIQRTMSGSASHRSVNPPKTKTGRRAIDLSAYFVEVLTQQRAHQALERQVRGDKWQEGGWVFTTVNGTWLSPAHVYTRFKGLAKQAGLPEAMRIHDLRHTMATYWLANGVPIKVVSERLGHANIGITLQIYAHVMPGMQAKASEDMDTWMRDRSSKSPEPSTRHPHEPIKVVQSDDTA